MKKPPTPDSHGHLPPPRSALDWPREVGLGRDLAREIRGEVARRRRKRGRAVAAVAFALVVGFFVFRRGAAPAPEAAAIVASSRVSAPERRTLPDGTMVDLRAGAVIEVEFTAAVRRVALARGEAHFEVARNPARPFVVVADGIEVRAVGTAFAVERGGESVEVIVTEGRVAVASATPAPLTAATPLAAGDRAVVSSKPAAVRTPEVTALSAGEISARLAWRVPRLEFSGAPLSDVVRLFAEHGRVRLAIGDPALGEVKVSGLLRADNTEALLQLLASDHGISAEDRSGEIVLVRR